MMTDGSTPLIKSTAELTVWQRDAELRSAGRTTAAAPTRAVQSLHKSAKINTANV
jgi:hypothetical protein